MGPWVISPMFHPSSSPFVRTTISPSTGAKEIIADVRKKKRPHQPLYIQKLEVERESSFKYLGIHISDDHTWSLNTTQLVKGPNSSCIF